MNVYNLDTGNDLDIVDNYRRKGHHGYFGMYEYV